LISSEEARERVSMPPRIVIPTLHHTALFMPAHIGNKKTLTEAPDRPSPGFVLGGTAIKVVCVPANSDSRGLPGTTLVLDEISGIVKAVVNARNLTALRNAAGSLLSTTLVGPSTPRKLVAFGAGKQIEAHLDLFIRHFPSISHCTIINRTINVRSNSLKETIKARFNHINLHIISSQEVSGKEDAVRSADIVICATSSTVPLFPSSWVRTGAHVILIGSFTPAMREVERELVLRAVPQSVDSPACLLVDSRKACLEEAGELIEAKLEPGQMTEIGELIRRNTNGRPGEGFDGPITMFKSVGVSLQDVAIAYAVVDHALSRSDGTRIEHYDLGLT